MEEMGSWLNPAAVVLGLVFAGLSTALQLMKDSPESRRMRGWIMQFLVLVWSASPGLVLAVGFPLLACVLGAVFAIQRANMIGRTGGVTSSNLVTLVVIVLFVACTFTTYLVGRVIDIDDKQNHVLERVLGVLERSHDRMEEMSRELTELRANRAAH